MTKPSVAAKAVGAGVPGTPAASEARTPAASAAASPSLLRTFRAVAWAFIGIRGKAGYDEDAAQLKPLHVIIAALVGVALFVGGCCCS